MVNTQHGFSFLEYLLLLVLRKNMTREIIKLVNKDVKLRQGRMTFYVSL